MAPHLNVGFCNIAGWEDKSYMNDISQNYCYIKVIIILGISHYKTECKIPLKHNSQEALKLGYFWRVISLLTNAL